MYTPKIESHVWPDVKSVWPWCQFCTYSRKGMWWNGTLGFYNPIEPTTGSNFAYIVASALELGAWVSEANDQPRRVSGRRTRRGGSSDVEGESAAGASMAQLSQQCGLLQWRAHLVQPHPWLRLHHLHLQSHGKILAHVRSLPTQARHKHLQSRKIRETMGFRVLDIESSKSDRKIGNVSRVVLSVVAVCFKSDVAMKFVGSQ